MKGKYSKLLAENILRQLHSNNTSQVDFAKQLNISTTGVSKLLKGQNCGIERVSEIAETLGVPAFTLLMPEQELGIYNAAKKIADTPEDLFNAATEIALLRAENQRLAKTKDLDERERKLFQYEISLLKKELAEKDS